MKKKISLLILTVSLAAVCCFAVVVAAFAADGNKNGKTVEFSDKIVALTPKNGESVSLVNDYIKTLFSGYNGEYSFVSKLFNTTDEMAEFTSILGDTDAVRALYEKWDDFKPVNCTLKWQSEVKANNYTVVVSKDSDISTAVYKTVTVAKEVTLDNVLYPDTTYYWQVTANVTGSKKIISQIFSFTTEDTIRTLDIQGVSNTRDIGGFDTPYGKTVNGIIFRSARIDDVTEKGIAQMDALGIKSDVDLRSLNEGKENPSARARSYPYLDAPMYLQIFDKEWQGNLKNIISLFADPENYPIIFHCSIGRDRTGTLSFILNNLLGVSQEEIICEYFTSYFSVAGAVSVSKETDDMLQTLSGMYLMLDGYDGETYAEKTQSFLLSIGVTQGEIDAIRDIMTGKTAILPSDAEYDGGYNGKVFVTFSSDDVADFVYTVDKGSVISAPYELKDGYFWTVNGEKADFSAAITENTEFIAKKAEGFTVTVINGGEKTETFYLKGTVLDLTQFQKEGYSTCVISGSGDIINSLTVESDIVLNIVYFQK